VLTTFSAKYIRGEQVTSLRWSGVVLIVVGAALVGYSEKARPAAPEPNKITPQAQVSKE
jgi:drug/metabolite transporter (DMT)-like permease